MADDTIGEKEGTRGFVAKEVSAKLMELRIGHVCADGLRIRLSQMTAIGGREDKARRERLEGSSCTTGARMREPRQVEARCSCISAILTRRQLCIVYATVDLTVCANSDDP